MLQNTGGRFIPNKFLTSQEQDYIKPSKIKGEIKKMPPSQPFKECTNHISSMKNKQNHQKLVLHGYEQGQQIEKAILNEKKNGELIECRKVSERVKKMIFDDLESSSEEQPVKNNIQVKKVVEKNSIYDRQTVKIEQKPEFVLEKQDSQKQNENDQFSRDRKKDKIFNLEFDDDDSSQEQQKKEINAQTNRQNYGVVKQIQHRDNRNQSCQSQKSNQQRESDNFIAFKPSKFINFQLGQSSDEEAVQNIIQIEEKLQKNNTMIPDVKKSVKKTVFEDADFHSSDSENYGQQTVRNQVNEQQMDECLEIVKKINFQKLMLLNNFSNNVITKTVIPEDHKLSLVVKRNSDKNVYTIFDSETVKKIIRIQKKFGGTYLFFDQNKTYEEEKKTSDRKEFAKMKVNFLGTEFDCYIPEKYGDFKVKKKVLSIRYELNIFGLNGPRKITLIAPQPNWPIRTDLTLEELYQKSKQKCDSGLKKYESKTPKWIPQINAYVLNMRGAANQSSIKNCVIISPQSLNSEYLIFGKKTKDVFNLQIKHPFTILQAIAFAISSFDRKIGCQ